MEEVELTPQEQAARERVCLALDVPTVKKALDLAIELSDFVGSCKIGKELHLAAGLEWVNIIEEIYQRGVASFLDLKFHDTPATVKGAAKAATVKEVSMFNIHLAGGEQMCRYALEGTKENIAAYDCGPFGPQLTTKVIGVTVLTSLSDEDLATQGLNIKYDDLVRRRTELAREWGLDGVVCPASKAGALEQEFGYDSNFIYVTPGVKWGEYKM